MKYVVFGIPGVGKTSVIKEVKNEIDFEHIHWGDLAGQIAKKEGYIEEIDELRKLDLKKQLKVKKLVVRHILNLSKNSSKDILVETHAAIKTPQGFLPGMDLYTLENLAPDVFIVIGAKPELVFQRRLLDESRNRKDDYSIEQVEESLRVTRQMAMTYAVLASGTVLFVENKQDNIDYAVNQIKELIERGQVAQDELGAI